MAEQDTLNWRKSTYSSGTEATCLEAGHAPGAVLVRDTTQHGHGPIIRVTPADWTRFTSSIKR